MEIPGTNQGVVESIIAKQQLSIRRIAELAKLSVSTIYDARRGIKGSWPTNFKLLILYIQLNGHTVV